MTIDLSEIQKIPNDIKSNLAGRLIQDIAHNEAGMLRLATESGEIYVYFEPANAKETARLMAENCNPEYRETLRSRMNDSSEGTSIDELINRDYVD